MAGLARLINPEPSKTLAYHTLQADEEARFAHPVSIPRAERYEPSYPPNGNLRLIIPNIDNPHVRDGLPASRRVNTSTRTVFHNDKVYETHDGISDRVASPSKLRCSAMKTSGHVTMNTVSATDPRQQHVDLATGPELGPGSYQTDPCGLQTTGAPQSWQPGQSHYTAPLHKDPTRASPAFKSPPRGKTMDDIAADKRASSVPFYAPHPDYASWQQKGVVLGRSERKIEAERWGKSIREPRAVLPEPEQGVVEPQVSSNGHAATCEQYLQDPGSPKYQVAFNSNLPRLVPMPAGGKGSDTRLRCKAREELYATSPSLGPGSYETDLPRYKSWNIAYQNAPGFRPHDVGPPSPSKLSTTGGSSRNASPGKLGVPRASQLMRAARSAAPSCMDTPLLTSRSQAAAAVGWPVIQLSSPATASPPAPALDSPFRAMAVAKEGTVEGPPSAAMSPRSAASEHFDVDQEPAITVNVLDALDADWAAHAAAVAQAYVRTDELRGASTLSARHGADCIPVTPVELHLPPHLSHLLAHGSMAVPTSGLPGKPSWSLSSTASSLTAAAGGCRVGAALVTKISCASATVGAAHTAELQERLSMACMSPSRSRAGSPGSPFKRQLVDQLSTVSSPTCPISMMLEVPAKLPGDDTLIFLRRSVPHSSQIHTQLTAVADLRMARHDAHGDMAAA